MFRMYSFAWNIVNALTQMGINLISIEMLIRFTKQI